VEYEIALAITSITCDITLRSCDALLQSEEIRRRDPHTENLSEIAPSEPA
jgi:hypothetical protein